MNITPEFNRYVNAFIKEFNKSTIEMKVTIDLQVMRFTPSNYDFKTIREIFKEIALFPLNNNQRVSFKDIESKELLECMKRFKEWANLNGFEWKHDQEEWIRICKLYE